MRTVLAIALMLVQALALAEPRASLSYRADLIRSARFVWGLDAPIPSFAAQIHQESGWRPDAQSAFAAGLTQFTPATAEWISGAYPNELGEGQPFNPKWAIRALVRYDRHLWERNVAATDCDRMAFVLAAYNGGNGWVNKDRRLTKAKGGDPLRWWGHVEKYSPRATWAYKENRDYPRKILYKWQPIYAGWGGKRLCLT